MQVGPEGDKVPLPAAGPGRSDAGGQGKFDLTAVKVIDWFIIY